ncbi:membrane-bound O-acyltransferase family protein [Deltaproteobacteria bacterium Smac51]|nr:membrane-bound O-acyltransferase family protein [Deltaproteobacteria bacterium Smac51]
MNFSDLFFIGYFLPAALLLYFACGFSRRAQNLCLLLISLVFYAWGEPLHLIPMLCLILINYSLGLRLTGVQTVSQRKRVIALTVALNAGLLLLVRHGPALATELSAQTGLAVPAYLLNWPPAPLGMAFFTLQAMAYVFDVARGKAAPDRNILNVGLYIALFPTVLAGPVLRYADMAAQIRGRKFSLEKTGLGGLRFVTGLAKLVLVAGPVGLVAEHIFNMSAAGSRLYDVPVTLAWLGLLAFSLKIYLSFSAYADMAIGLGGMFGFTIKENFRYPYAALTVTDFWRRWHISLFRWFYSYVYIALGGSRPQTVRRRGGMVQRNMIVRNLLIMWSLIGLWHGLSWTYFLWGLWFFIFYVFEWITRLPHRGISGPGWRVYLLLTVCLSWVLFRSHSLGDSLNYYGNLLGLTSNGFYSQLAVILVRENWLPFLLGLLLSTPIGGWPLKRLAAPGAGTVRYPLAVGYLTAATGLFFLSLVYLSRTGPVPLPFIF